MKLKPLNDLYENELMQIGEARFRNDIFRPILNEYCIKWHIEKIVLALYFGARLKIHNEIRWTLLKLILSTEQFKIEYIFISFYENVPNDE